MTALQLLMLNTAIFWIFCLLVTFDIVQERSIENHPVKWLLGLMYVIISTPIYFTIHMVV